MATLQSKKVNIVLDSNNDVDLYDEQIDTNKSVPEKNKKDIATLKGLIANNDSEITLVKSQVTALKNAKPVLTQAEVDKIRKDIDNTIKTTNINTTDLTNLTNKVNTNTTNIANTTNNLTNLTTVVKKIDQVTTGGAYTSGIGGGSGSETGFDIKIANLNTRLTNDESDINQLKIDVSNNKTSIGDLSNQLSSFKTNVNSSIANINNKNGIQDGRLTSLENKINSLNTQLNGSGGSSSGGSVQSQINSIKSDINTINNTKIPSINNLTNNAYNKALSAVNTINNTINPKLTNLTSQLNDVENDIDSISDTINNTIISKINTNTTNITNNTNAINALKKVIKPNVQDKTINAGGNTTINYDSTMDLYSMQIKVLVKDTMSGSRTINKYINAEGVCTLAYNSKNSITLYNDADAQLDFKIIISI